MPGGGRITRQDRAQVEPLPTPARPAPLDPPIAGDMLAWTLPVLETFATGLGVTVGWEALRASHDGSYRARERRIMIHNGVAVNQQVAALVHQLAHALVDLDQHSEEPALDYASEERLAWRRAGTAAT